MTLPSTFLRRMANAEPLNQVSAPVVMARGASPHRAALGESAS